MQSQATVRYIRVTPRKMRLVADLVRGKGINDALTILKFNSRNRVSVILTKLLESAVANADQQGRIDVDTLFIKKLFVDQGPTLKRYETRAKGSANLMKKKTSHVSVVLEER